MKEKGQYDTTPEGLFAGVDMVRTALQNYGMKTASLQKAKLLTEETISSMAAYAEPGAKITLSIKAVLETVTMELSCKGTEFQHADNISGSSWKDYMEEGQTEEDAAKRLSSMLVQTYAEEVKYQHKAGLNRVRIVVVRSKHAFLYRTLGALLLAILAGLLLSSLQLDIFNSLLDTYMLVPVKTMYMNALKMIVSPVVFFSIVSCIVRFSDLSELGRLGGRVILLYLLTTCIAVAVGIGSFYLFQPGNAGSAPAVTADISSITSAEVNISTKDLIVNIVPSNFIKPFLESNMLQLIFLAVICGIATGLIGKYSVIVKDIFEAFNDLFLKITTMIIGFMPIAIFCSILSMVLNTGAKTFLSVMGMFGTFLFGLACMMIVYCLLILIAGRLSPLPFIKKYSSTMLQVFSMASSNASIPVNMDACEKLGIAKKIYSLSIPLGATLNMDGTCVHLAVFSLALAKIYGVQVTGASMVAIIISIIVLSMGSPGIAGAGLICLSVLLEQMGVPLEAIGLVMGIDPLVGMFRCMSNCLGDVAVSTVVAKKEGVLDIETYTN